MISSLKHWGFLLLDWGWICWHCWMSPPCLLLVWRHWRRRLTQSTKWRNIAGGRGQDVRGRAAQTSSAGYVEGRPWGGRSRLGGVNSVCRCRWRRLKSLEGEQRKAWLFPRSCGYVMLWLWSSSTVTVVPPTRLVPPFRPILYWSVVPLYLFLLLVDIRKLATIFNCIPLTISLGWRTVPRGLYWCYILQEAATWYLLYLPTYLGWLVGHRSCVPRVPSLSVMWKCHVAGTTGGDKVEAGWSRDQRGISSNNTVRPYSF